MGQWTNFPFGISLTTSTGTVAGQLNASNITVTSSTNAAIGLITAGTVSVSGAVIAGGAVALSSTLTVGSASGIIGAYHLVPVVFGTASALEQKAIIIGVPSLSIDAVYQTVSATSALVANYTVQIGSAGAVAVATVANTTQSVGVVNSLTTTAQTFDGTASAVVCIRSVQGTTGETSLVLVCRRSA